MLKNRKYICENGYPQNNTAEDLEQAACINRSDVCSYKAW